MTPALTPELYVQDIARSEAFYAGLRFDVLYRRPGFLYLNHHGAHLMLEEPGQGAVWLTGPLEPPYGRGVSLQITTPELAPLLDALGAWPLFRPVEEAWYETAAGFEGQRQFLVQDPDGYLLRFAEDLGLRPTPPEGVRVQRS